MMAPKDIRSYPRTCECDLVRKKHLADVVKDLEMGRGTLLRRQRFETWRGEGPENRGKLE